MYCTEVSETCPIESNIYGYYPSLPANTFFSAWFAIFFLSNIILGIRFKAWTYMLALATGCAVEAIGYSGRIILHHNPFSVKGFQIQICCLIIGPAFNSAAVYLTLKHITLTFGPEYSMLRPRWYTYIFIAGDILSLVLQAIGGSVAANAGDDSNRLDMGNNIMMAGIAFQVVTLVSFGMCAAWYVWMRVRAARQGHHLPLESAAVLHDVEFGLFIFGVVTAFFAILARCVYRIIEMAGGWGSAVMRDEISYIVLEGALIAYATGAQTILHPGFCFPQLTGSFTKKSHGAEREKEGD